MAIGQTMSATPRVIRLADVGCAHGDRSDDVGYTKGHWWADVGWKTERRSRAIGVAGIGHAKGHGQADIGHTKGHWRTDVGCLERIGATDAGYAQSPLAGRRRLRLVAKGLNGYHAGAAFGWSAR